MIRSFVAVDLTPELRGTLNPVLVKLKKLNLQARIPRPEAIHLTLKFLGNIEKTRLPEIESALRGAASSQSSFSLSAVGLGAFPYLANPRIVWAGFGESPELAGLHGKVEARLEELGFAPENRDFHPHLTLARIKSRKNIAHLIEFLETHRTLSLGDLPVTQFHLFQSTLKPTGAEYSKLADFRLEG